MCWVLVLLCLCVSLGIWVCFLWFSVTIGFGIGSSLLDYFCFVCLFGFVTDCFDVFGFICLVLFTLDVDVGWYRMTMFVIDLIAFCLFSLPCVVVLIVVGYTTCLFWVG